MADEKTGRDKPTQLPTDKPDRRPDQDRPEVRPRPDNELPEQPTPKEQARELVEKRFGTKLSPGSVTQEHKVPLTEELIKRAIEEDTEDTREETSGYERHDLIIVKELNIPPSIVQDRLKNNQNPATGEGWSKEDRLKYQKDAEQARQQHAKAVKEFEEKMREEMEAPQGQFQPVAYIPNEHLTDDQRRAMQKAQDEGKGPVAQARARDENHPDKVKEKANA